MKKETTTTIDFTEEQVRDALIAYARAKMNLPVPNRMPDHFTFPMTVHLPYGGKKEIAPFRFIWSESASAVASGAAGLN